RKNVLSARNLRGAPKDKVPKVRAQKPAPIAARNYGSKGAVFARPCEPPLFDFASAAERSRCAATGTTG
ncbi:MAG: hypothetical protein J2P51_06260, partial [Hyphomicrobiaceae bacterium]|nr:hypothetical protein [Hyphomicrobiaceae bacterium]